MATDTELKPPPDLTTPSPEETQAKGDILRLGDQKATLAKGYEESVKKKADEIEAQLNKPKPTAPEVPNYPALPSQKIRPFADNTPGEPWQVTAQKAMMNLGLLAQGVGGLVTGYPKGALAAMEGAYQGWAEGDKERGDRQFKEWGALTEQMKDKYEQDRQHFRDLWESWEGDLESLKAKLSLESAKMGASQGAIEALQQNPETILKWLDDRKKLSLESWQMWNQMALHKQAKDHQDAMLADSRRRTDEMIKDRMERRQVLKGNINNSEAIDAGVDLLVAGMPRSQIVSGRGSAGQMEWEAILERAKSRGIDLTKIPSVQADRAAHAQAQAQLQKQTTMMSAWEQTAQKNLAMAMDLSKKVDRTGKPFVDKWLLAGKKAWGDPEAAAWISSLRVANNEIARVVNSASGAGVLTDAARKEIDTVLSPDMAPDQLEFVVNVLQRDMRNRIESNREGLAQNLREFPGQKPAAPSPGGQAPATHRYDPATGKLEEIK